MRRGINTALGIVVAITLYLPIAGAAGGESKAKKTPSPASAVHLSKTRTAQAKADRKPKAKVVSEKKKTHQNKTANGQQVKPFVLPVEKSEGTPVPIGERVAEWSVVDRGEAKRAANSSNAVDDARSFEAAGIGSLMVSMAPLRSARLAASSLPPNASTKPRATASPNPVPAMRRSAALAR